MPQDNPPKRTARKKGFKIRKPKPRKAESASGTALSVTTVLIPPPEPKKTSYIVKPGHTKLDTRLIEQFCELAQRGVPATSVCDYLGIHYGAFREWLDKGERFLQMNGEADPTHADHASLVLSFKRASAKYCIDMVYLINSGAESWYRGIVVLERRDRKNWGKADQLGGEDDSLSSDDKFL